MTQERAPLDQACLFAEELQVLALVQLDQPCQEQSA